MSVQLTEEPDRTYRFLTKHRAEIWLAEWTPELSHWLANRLSEEDFAQFLRLLHPKGFYATKLVDRIMAEASAAPIRKYVLGKMRYQLGEEVMRVFWPEEEPG